MVDALKEGLQLRATYNPTRTRKGRVPAFGSPNHGLIVASTTARIDPRRPICPLVGVRFTQARDLPNLTRDLVRTPEKRRPVTEDRRALRPARVVKRLPAPQTVTTRSTTEVSHEHQ